MIMLMFAGCYLGAATPEQLKDFTIEKARASAGAWGGLPLAEPIFPRSLPGSPVAASMSAAGGLDWEALYKRGGLVALVWGPRDPVSRRISLKLRTAKDANQNVYEKLAVCDVSYQSDTFCQTFQVGGTLDSTAPLDDRQPGFPDYTLRISPSSNDGRSHRIPGKVPLGLIHGELYYLVFDSDLGYWVATR